jgi:hypothetical protein
MPFAVALGLLAGCTGSVVTTPAYINPNYDPAMLSYAVKEGPVFTEIIGTPFPGEEDRVADIVTQTLREAQITGRRLQFTTDPSVASGRSPYRAIVLFNPAPGAAAGRICTDSNQPQTERVGERVKVMVAYCNGGNAVSSVTGWTKAETADAPQFAQLFKQVSLEIFPSLSVYSRSDGGNFERN